MTIGTKLGRYRITGRIGEGGMGQVFRADDERLHRQVAVKVLPPEMATDPERLARMEREAQTLAQLEHPNVAAIYGLEEGTPEGEQSPVRFLVMQLVDGETLAARIDAGRVPVQEALQISLQIAQALEAAHDKGIVHRDLKPANVMLSSDGKVKLLDFGLAKVYAGDAGGSSPSLSVSPTVMEATKAGMILGTAGYMSPEQARGKAIDRRTDVWAFGCVLYEMLTGQRLFHGETVTDVLGAIIHREPNWNSLPADTPRPVRTLLERCLRKDVSRRVQAIGEARVAIEEYLENPGAPEAIPRAVPAEAARTRFVPWVLFGVAAIAAAALAVTGRRATPAAPVSRFSVEVGDNPVFGGQGSSLAVSADGSHIAIVQTAADGRRLSVRAIDQLGGTVLSDKGNPYNPFFSPDGQWIGYVTTTSLQKVPTSGGTALTLAQINRGRGATWATDDTIILAPSPASGLFRVPAAGGELKPLTTLDEKRGEVTHRWPQYLPGHDAVIFTAHTAAAGFDNATIEALNLKTGERKTVYRGGSYGRYIPTGHLLFVNRDTIFAVPFDAARLEVTGSPAPIAQGVSYNGAEGGAQFDVADNGLLVFRSGSSAAPVYQALWVDARGEGTPLWEGTRSYAEPHISPDGTKVAFMVYADNNWDVWVYDRVRQVSTRLTFGDGVDGPPVWSPDGRFIAFSSSQDGPINIYRKRADGSGEAERITNSKDAQYVSSWSSDGKYLLFSPQTKGTDLWTVALDGDRKPEVFLATEFGENEGAFSPDVKWVAYQSNESGRVEVYVRPFHGQGGKWQVSEGGGGYPRWSGDGRQLFFRSDEGVMAVSIAGSGDSLQAGRAHRVLQGNFRGGAGGFGVGGLVVADYDVSRDGSHFVLFPLDVKAAGRTEHLTFVLNWFTELKRLLPASR